MSVRLPSFLKWPATLTALAGLLAAAYVVHDLIRRERQAEAGDAVQVPRRAESNVVKLGARLAESHGLKDEPAQQLAWVPQLPVYGRVVPNPQATLEVRSSFAGTLRADPDQPWPAPGKWVRAGQVLGRVDIRVGPLERLDVQAKLDEARRKEQGAEEVLKLRQDRVNRLEKLVPSEVINRRELDEALIALAEARTQVATVRAAMDVWQKALAAMDRAKGPLPSAWSEPLTASAEGEVTEVLTRPGTAVEAGAVLARLVDVRRPLVRLDVSPEALAAGPLPQVELCPASVPPHSLTSSSCLTGTLVGPAPQVDVASQFAGYLYEARTGPSGSDTPAGAAWRPGLFVKASWKVPAARPQAAVSVPRTALLYHQGRSLVYVRIGPGRYERREVQVLGRAGERWALAGGVVAGEAVVYRQAQVLLSEEFRGDVDED